MTLDAIGREPSEAVIDIYIRGFLRLIVEKIAHTCPDVVPQPQQSLIPPSQMALYQSSAHGLHFGQNKMSTSQYQGES